MQAFGRGNEENKNNCQLTINKRERKKKVFLTDLIIRHFLFNPKDFF